MLRHLGYVAICLTHGISSNRTCRLRNATPERLRELITSNLSDLERTIQFNIERGVHFYRVSSDVIPFASHSVNTIPWWEEYADVLARIGGLLRQGSIRATMHPGQFTVLNSPTEKVVLAAKDEIAWHVKLLDLLGMGPEGKIVIHVGGAFGDKPAAMDRFTAVVATLPDGWKRRLVIENDEHVYSVEDVLELSNLTGLPMIYDNLHDKIHSGREDGPGRWLPEVFATWKPEDGVPKVHFSNQSENGRVGHHSDFIDRDDFARYLEVAPKDTAFDCMLECKQKDVALFRLREELSL